METIFEKVFFMIYISVLAEKVCFQCISLVLSEKTRFSWSFIHAGTTSQLAQLPTGTTSPWNNFPNHNFPLAQLPYSYNFPIHTTSLWHNLPLVQLPYGTTYPWDNFPMAQLTPGTTSLWHNLPLAQLILEQLPYGTSSYGTTSRGRYIQVLDSRIFLMIPGSQKYCYYWPILKFPELIWDSCSIIPRPLNLRL